MFFIFLAKSLIFKEKSPLLDAGSDTEVQSPNNTQAYRSGIFAHII